MRFGLFGTGPWAHFAHAPALAEHAGAELVGVWGRNPEKAAELAEKYGSRPYAEIDELIADVDAVAIALPPDVQAPIALRAARAGRHLLLDKPVALTAAAATEIADAVAVVGLFGDTRPKETATFAGYLITTIAFAPVAVYLARMEPTRWGNLILGVACLVLPVLVLRLQQIASVTVA
jgi:ornithine cyclodeaminase/alanine dehydrogenase-like protein (mu-crystallin family)